MENTELHLPFGHSNLSVEIPSYNLLGICTPREDSEEVDETVLLAGALAYPVGTPPLREVARSGQKVVIVTSDLTRPCPSERLLPPVLEELARAGIAAADVIIVIALGLHRPMTASELEAAVGADVYGRVQVVNHAPENTIRLGITSAGTPVEIFCPVVEADLLVCLGNLEFHYFAGYSGGAKAILPGCASRATLNANHAMMVHPDASAGRLEDNPVRLDIEEGADMVGIDFILNVLVDGHHRISGAVAGHVKEAHRRGCELVAQRGTVEIPQQADIVLVSAGGYPSDLNLYQAQKALDNAAHAVREGGIIIWVAECSEGLGNQIFETWLLDADSPEDILDRIQREFVLGGHKAAAMAAVMQQATIYLVSSLPDKLVRDCGLVPFASLDMALGAAFAKVGQAGQMIALPQGCSVMPVVG
jgi:nickel-dependent lactate racemase